MPSTNNEGGACAFRNERFECCSVFGFISSAAHLRNTNTELHIKDFTTVQISVLTLPRKAKCWTPYFHLTRHRISHTRHGRLFVGLLGRAMASFGGSPGPSVLEGGRSYVDVARRTGFQQQNDRRREPQTKADGTSVGVPDAATLDGTVRSSETAGVASKPSRSARAIVHGLGAKLAQGQQNSEQKQVQSKTKTNARGVRAQVANMQKALEEMQVRLVHEQHQRADDGAKLRKANVLLQAKHQEMEDLQADRDRLQATVEGRNATRLLAGGINIQAACPTLPEIEASIRGALTVTASEWVEGAPPALSATVPLHWVLSQVVLGCWELVNNIVRTQSVFMGGGVESQGGASTMDTATVDVFRQHIRRHHRALFPLTGQSLHRACNEVVTHIGLSLAPYFSDMAPSMVVSSLRHTGLERVVAEYLQIFVGAAIQHPVATFSLDCGMKQQFDANIHAESIDGDAVSIGQDCSVVFPALLVEHEGRQGHQPLTKRYILPV